MTIIFLRCSTESMRLISKGLIIGPPDRIVEDTRFTQLVSKATIIVGRDFVNVGCKDCKTIYLWNQKNRTVNTDYPRAKVPFKNCFGGGTFTVGSVIVNLKW